MILTDVRVHFFQLENGIQARIRGQVHRALPNMQSGLLCFWQSQPVYLLPKPVPCLLYTSDAADDLLCVDLGGRRILKKKEQQEGVSVKI